MAESKKYTKAWIPPERFVSLPVLTREQILPLNELPWDIFQRLCTRLAGRCGDVDFCQEYGIPGQNQEGIDIYVRKSGSPQYAAWQCRRYQDHTVRPSLIEGAVSDFLSGSWVSRTDEFILALSAQTERTELSDVIEAQANRLRERNILFVPLGITQISERLKGHPDIVDDFFGRAWVQEFCGAGAEAKLSGRRLQPAEIIRLRQLLRRCYTEHFDVTDPGLPSLTGYINPDDQPLRLADRFVPPDVLEERILSRAESVSEVSEEPGAQQSTAEDAENQTPSSPRKARAIPRVTEVRRPAVNWLSNADLSIVLGDAGTGKSALLRCLLLDLLSTEPRFESCAQRWGQYLPVWVPFAMWTRLVGESESKCSLSDVLTAWLCKVSAEEELITLVQQALDDSRLLLFVDGLDEWSDETTAQTTLTLLEQFVGERDIPAIASSRPLGYARIGKLSGKWREARLAGLTKAQQSTLAEHWFIHRSNAYAAHVRSGESIDVRKTRAKAEAAEHMQDLHRDVRLARLAEVPLLLNGLIALAIQRIRLPRSRFKAYDELTRLLLEEQPKRRQKSAFVPRSISALNPETRERAMARLAWETHQSPGSDALGKTVAGDVLAEFCSNHLGKNPGEAIEVSNELLAIGAETVGILIEKSAADIGFPHRAFQEFLAARHLSNLPFEEQEDFVRERFRYPQWHDVFLCLCHLNTRAGEVDKFVAIVESLQLPGEMELARRSFLAAIAFGDLHCSVDTARRLAEQTFEVIETDVQEPTRKRLVEHALDGLESDSLRSVAESRVQHWFPARHPYRSGIYEAITAWPRSKETKTVLWHGLLSEEEWNQRPAAESLARVFGGDLCVSNRLRDLLFVSAEPRLLSFALHALCLGWKDDPRLPAILNDTRSSVDAGLQSVALIHRVARHEQNAEDRAKLMTLSEGHDRGSWYWVAERARALITGWPEDLEIKEEAIHRVKEGRNYGGIWDREWSGVILLEGYPQDDEVAETIANLFKYEEYPGFGLGIHHNWDKLVGSFAGHRIVGRAVDDWLVRKMASKGNLFWDFGLCLVSKSARAKGLLLEADNETGVITEYQAPWLLRGWGMDDEEAAAALTKLAESPQCQQTADLLPDILPDKKLCRQRLLEILRNEREYFGRRALLGLVKLGSDEFDEEVVEAAVNIYKDRVPSGVAYGGIRHLIEHFSDHAEVRKVALHQIHKREGDINTVARIYGSDKEIRCEIVDSCSPLPAFLRAAVVDRLARLAPEDDFAHRLLANYDEDVDVNVKTAAAIGYAASLRRRGDIIGRLSQLKEGLSVTGPDYHERRQAAFAALLELDRLDIVKQALTEGAKMHFNMVPANLNLTAHLAYHWDRVSTAFGDTFWDRVDGMPDEFLSELADRSANWHEVDEILDKFGKWGEGETTISLPLLRLQARRWRSTSRLRELCVTLVGNCEVGNWEQAAQGIVAAEILADQFGGDSETLIELETLVCQEPASSALAIALSTGWPSSRAWEQLQKRLRKQDGPGLMFPAHFHFLAASESPEEFVRKVADTMAQMRGSIWEFATLCSRAVSGRFARDKDVCELAFGRLETHPTSSEKMNLPFFLLENNEQPERLRNWMRLEVKRQSESTTLVEFALDMSSGTVRSVRHVLLEYLMV